MRVRINIPREPLYYNSYKLFSSSDYNEYLDSKVFHRFLLCENILLSNVHEYLNPLYLSSEYFS